MSRDERLGCLIGASFGLVYVVVNAGALPSALAAALRLVGVAAFIAVLAALRRAGPANAAASPERGHFGRGYQLVVAGEVAAGVAGLALLNGPLDTPRAGVAWVSLVVGVHFVALGGLWREPSLRWLGAGIAGCGAAGLILAVAGAGASPIAAVSGVVPGALLLAGSWWGTRAARGRAARNVA
jgi:hypothetical protein